MDKNLTVKNKIWDAAIIGSGFGGSMIALSLAQAGMRVLMLERGRWIDRDDCIWSTGKIPNDSKYRSTSSYNIKRKRRKPVIFANEAVGGNSLFYGGASFRLRTKDFLMHKLYGNLNKEKFPYVDWPIRYEQFKSYYEEAERQLGVAGIAGVDPYEPSRDGDYSRAPPPFGTTAGIVANAAESIGLKPFPIPLAINFFADSNREKCTLCTACDLFPCKIGAKNDLAVTVLPKAIRSGLVISQGTVAKRLIISRDRIKRVECHDLIAKEKFDISCRLCVVCGGALESAKLLIASGLGGIEPNGLLIGRFLMCHSVGVVIGLFPFKTNPEQKFQKQVAIMDYYFGHPARRLPHGPWGMIQSLQVPPPEYIRSQAPFPFGSIGAGSTKYQIYLLCIAADLPNPNNRITFDPVKKDCNGLPIAHINHIFNRRDIKVRRALCREGTQILRKAGAFMRFRIPNYTFSHACGTCRFGSNPETSVLDPMCKFHGMSNLFVVDSSFMPTSSSVNPSLTIAANALRVGKHITDNWEQIVK